MNSLKLLLIVLLSTLTKICFSQHINTQLTNNIVVDNNSTALSFDQIKTIESNKQEKLATNPEKLIIGYSNLNLAEERRVYVTETMKPNTDYFISPSGFSLPKGILRATNTYFIINNATYGVTDNFSLSVGFTPFVKFYSINAKYAIQTSEYLHFAVMANFATTINSGFRLNGGTFGGLCTIGKSDYNITLGVNLGRINAISLQKPVFNISGISRISEKFAITMDNYFISRPRFEIFDSINQNTTVNTSKSKFIGFFSYGVRLLKPKTFIDFGLITPLKGGFGDGNYLFALPYFKVSRQVF